MSNRIVFNTWLPADQHAKLKDMARQRCIPFAALVRSILIDKIVENSSTKTPREIEREQREAEKQQKLKRREIVARQQRIMKGVYKFDEYIAMEEGRLTRDELLSDADIDLAARLEGVDRSKYDHESSEPAVSPDELFERERAAYLARTSVVEPVDEWIED